MGREQIQWCFISWSCIYLFKREAHTQGNRTSEDTAGSLKRVWGPTWIWFHHLQLCLLTHVPSQLSDSWPPVSETQVGPNHTALSFSPVSAACCEESRTPSTPHLVSGSGHVDAMSTRRRAGVRKGAGFASVLEEPQAASTPQAEWGRSPPRPELRQKEALLKGLFSPPAGCTPWRRGDDLRGPQQGQRLLAVPRIHHLLPGVLEIPVFS